MAKRELKLLQNVAREFCLHLSPVAGGFNPLEIRPVRSVDEILAAQPDIHAVETGPRADVRHPQHQTSGHVGIHFLPIGHRVGPLFRRQRIEGHCRQKQVRIGSMGIEFHPLDRFSGLRIAEGETVESQ